MLTDWLNLLPTISPPKEPSFTVFCSMPPKVILYRLLDIHLLVTILFVYPIKKCLLSVLLKSSLMCVCVCYEMENEFLTQFVLDGFQDAVWIAQHARCCRADLNEEFSHGLTQEHGVKCCYFINSHWSNFQHLCNLNLNKCRQHISFLTGKIKYYV